MTIKKSFLIHIDSLDVLDHLTDEQCGQLLRAFKSYHYGEELNLPSLLSIAFTPFKNQFKRDLETYENVCNRNKINGLKGGRPKNPNNPSGLLKTQRNPKKPKKPDSDNKKDSDSDKDNKKGSKNANDNDKQYLDIDGLNINAFNKYINYRKESGIKKLTQQGEKIAANKLINLGANEKMQMDIVEQSIGNGWAGLFEFKQVNNKKQTRIDTFNEWIDSSDDYIDGECDVIN